MANEHLTQAARIALGLEKSSAAACPVTGPSTTVLESRHHRPRADMDEWEIRIREKVWAANILSPGEWVYLVGLFQIAKEKDI